MPMTPTGVRLIRCACGQVVARVVDRTCEYESPIRFQRGRLELRCFACHTWVRLPTSELKQAA